ncbi:MAG TPA: inositol monophosphatase family protein [Rickettsiales bacterium]|nr:inositol monophosphatase family protein [Rickettsiales bacterium]
MPPRSAILNVMTSAALKAGKSVLRDFGELDKLQVSRKSIANFATNADNRSEKILHQELSKARPAFSFVMEEGGSIEGSDPSQRFVIDPIDGTHNFIHAVPYFCISIAYEKKLANGQFETQAGVIYDPIQNELFCAELYQGATMNDQRLSVSGRMELDTCLIATFTPPRTPHAAKVYTALASNPFGLRATGSTALDLAYVAAGRYDGACFVSWKHWDVAAGKLLVREAGGKITESSDEDKKMLFVSNPHIHSKIAASLAG